MKVSEELLTQRLNQAACEVYKLALQERNNAYYQQNVGLDDLLSPAQMQTHFEKGIPDVMARAPYTDKLEEVRNKIQIATAWRVEGTLREFAKFKPVNMWFSYPVHALDESGVLADIKLEDDRQNYQKKAAAKAREGRKTKEENLEERTQAFEDAYEARKSIHPDEPVTKKEIAEFLGVKVRTIESRIKENENFVLKNGKIFKIKE